MSSGTSLSSASTKYRNFKEITRHRLLNEMLRSCKTWNSKSTWKVLVMDEFTVKIMSHACTVVDTTNEGVSLLERIDKKRQRLPSMDAIYFIRPSKENVRFFLSDMSGGVPFYRKAFVFFTSPISKHLVGQIKADASLRSRISALSEMNLEYYAIDSQGFVTNNQRALQQLYGDKDDSREAEACLNEMAARVATVFASLRVEELPVVHYRAANRFDATVETTFCDLIPTKLAAGIWDSLMHYKRTIPDFPQRETCELLILDRSVDQIAPIIHEWTYDALCHDLLEMEGNKYVHEVANITGGPPDKKDVLLDECDPVWLELRDRHLGFALEWLKSELSSLKQNKVARFENSRDGQSPEVSSRELKDITEALPQYLELKEKLSLHIEIASKLNTIVRNFKLPFLSELEQSLVYGDAGIREVIMFLRIHGPSIGREHMLRLLMIAAAIYPEFLKDGGYLQMMMKHANLLPQDMTAVRNMKLIGKGQEGSSGIFPMKFGIAKRERYRKERPREDEWRYSRFSPMIEELIEKLSNGALSEELYPCVNPNACVPKSRRTPTWAHRRTSDDGLSRYASSGYEKMGQRIFVVIVGGATRSELRVCHKLTAKLKREVILGSSSLDDPASFVTNLKMITAENKPLMLDDVQI
uniref:SNARE-interacting protein KEULE-like isoform X1 n=1 Tax=Fragaria vesca subsp. vesca TaxID=101020 RepID=UPI0005CADE5A|nr:PREDICTED: SNARE-interacting protein KEULE-like isoform X1 [Fragaria vesca subsp. vesca]